MFHEKKIKFIYIDQKSSWTINSNRKFTNTNLELNKIRQNLSSVYIKLTTVVKGNLKAPFSIATTPRCRGRVLLFSPGLLHFIFDAYLIMLSVKQGVIKYLFLNLWYDLTWDWIPVSQAIGEHCIHTHKEYIFIYTKSIYMTGIKKDHILLKQCLL